MVYNTQNYCVFGLYASSRILKTREHNNLETGFFHLQVRRETPILLPNCSLYNCSYADVGCPVIEVRSF
jgi:hypothetical protein